MAAVTTRERCKTGKWLPGAANMRPPEARPALGLAALGALLIPALLRRGPNPNTPTEARMNRLAIVALCACLAAPAALASQITPIADAQRGTMVTVKGLVERITDEDEFRLADATGSIRIYVGPNWVPAELGETVIVSGFVDDSLIPPREIYARSLTRADGTVITFERRHD